MFDLTAIFQQPVYGLEREEKDAILSEGLGDLTAKHYAGCPGYRKVLDLLGFQPEGHARPEDFPFLPVRLFKQHELLSVPREAVVKTMTSSGTTGQQVSRIYLDRETSANQSKALARIAASFLGSQRLPMLIIDSPSVVRNRKEFSARGAGILGFSMLGRDHAYALDERMEPDAGSIASFVERHSREPVLVFGFTYMIWLHFLKRLEMQRTTLDLPQGIMIHGGGWKRLAEQAVDNATFKRLTQITCGISKVFNYYGMVEQTGSIFMECEHGRLHAPLYSDVIIRDPKNFNPVAPGGQGLVQLVSLLPGSYPGHSILSEDWGGLMGVDDCPCGRKGKTLEIHGRIQSAEVRGCSDTYASERQ